MVLGEEQTHRSMEQNSEPRNRPTYSQLASNKNNSTEKDSHFSKWCWNNRTSKCKKKKKKERKLTDLIPFTKINTGWIIRQNVKYKTVKLLEDNTGQPQGGHEFDDFLDTATKGQFIKEKC